MIVHAYGIETNSWLGKSLELHVEPVPFQGRMFDAIRVRVPLSQPAAAPQSAAVTQSAPAPAVTSAPTQPGPTEIVEDDIDF